MSFLGANDDDDNETVLIRAPKRDLTAPKPLVPAGPAVIKKYPIRLCDYRRRTAAAGEGAAPEGGAFGRHFCAVVDKVDVGALVGGADDDVSPPIHFTPAALNDGNGVLYVKGTQKEGAKTIPFAATRMTTMPVADAMGNEPVTASASHGGAVFVVECTSTSSSPSATSASATAAAAAPLLLLTPIDAIWRARRMIELETANNDDPAAASFFAAWAMSIESMDRRDKTISGEVSHYDDAIEAAPAVADPTELYEARVKKLQSELDEIRGVDSKQQEKSASSASSAEPSRAAQRNAAAAVAYSAAAAVSRAMASASSARHHNAPPPQRASPPPTVGMGMSGIGGKRAHTNATTEAEVPSKGAEPEEKKLRAEDMPSGAVLPVLSAAAVPAAASPAPPALVSSVDDIVRRMVSEEKASGSTNPDASKFVGKLLKALPDFAAVAAAKDKAREVEWLKESKAKVLAALKACGCEIAGGKVVLTASF